MTRPTITPQQMTPYAQALRVQIWRELAPLCEAARRIGQQASSSLPDSPAPPTTTARNPIRNRRRRTMGDSLKRAFAAAARTRSDASLTPEMRAFLDVLAPHSKPVTRTMLGCVTSKAEERARAACRRLGYAKFHRLSPADPLGWQITPLGRQKREAPAPLDREARE